MAHAVMTCGTRRTNAVLRSLLALLLELSLARAQPKPFQSRCPAPTLFPQMKALISPSPHQPSRGAFSAGLRSLQQCRNHNHNYNHNHNHNSLS